MGLKTMEKFLSLAEVEAKELKDSLELKLRLLDNKDTECNLRCLFILY